MKLPAKVLIYVSGRYLLDTNIIIPLLNGERSIREALENAEEIFLPATAVGELYFGAAKSGRPEANRTLINDFLRGRIVLACDSAVAHEYGRIKSLLKSQGTPLPENDVWIAATALHHELVLVSRDQHFRAIAELTTINW